MTLFFLAISMLYIGFYIGILLDSFVKEVNVFQSSIAVICITYVLWFLIR